MPIIAPGQEAIYGYLCDFLQHEGILCILIRIASSNEYTQYTIFNIERKIDLNYLKSAAMGVCPGDSISSSKQP